MGIKLEGILLVSIIVIISSSFMVKLNTTESKSPLTSKELVFTNTVFTEVNQNLLLGHATVSEGIYENKLLTVKDILYKTDDIEYMQANNGIYEKDILYVENDVELQEVGGALYKTQQAVYNQKTQLLELPNTFGSIYGQNVIEGDSLIYDLNSSKMMGKSVSTVFYTAE